MFTYSRFSLSQFSLGDEGSVYKIEQAFGEDLNIVAGATVPLDAASFFSAVFRGSTRGTVASQVDFHAVDSLHASCQAQVNVLTGAAFAEGFSQRTAGVKNIYTAQAFGESLPSKVWGCKDIPWAEAGTESFESSVTGVKNIYTGQFTYEVLTALTEAIKQSTEVASFEITLPPGGELRIDSGTFRVTLDGENILYAQAGDWINLSRELLYLDIESATGGQLQGTLIYTERFL